MSDMQPCRGIKKRAALGTPPKAVRLFCSVCLPPGRGTFDIKQLKSKLLMGGYTGDYIIEIYSPGFDVERELVRSRIFLEGI